MRRATTPVMALFLALLIGLLGPARAQAEEVPPTSSEADSPVVTDPEPDALPESAEQSGSAEPEAPESLSPEAALLAARISEIEAAHRREALQEKALKKAQQKAQEKALRKAKLRKQRELTRLKKLKRKRKLKRQRAQKRIARRIDGRNKVVLRARGVALRQLGTPYRYGGTTPAGFDCSGFVGYAYRIAGYQLPRTSGAIAGHTRRIAKKALRPGDLMFFHSGSRVYHVGMFLKWTRGGALMVHSPRPGEGVKRQIPWTSSWFAGTVRLPANKRAIKRASRPASKVLGNVALGHASAAARPALR